jgi:uncharacterized protein with PIN domain
MTYQEYLDGFRFEAHGKKSQGCHPDNTRKVLVERFERITAHTARRVAESNRCWHCNQALSDAAREAMLRHTLALRVALGDVILNPDGEGAYTYTPQVYED